MSQTGFMQKRNISHNIRKVMDIMQFAQENKIDALLISLDFEKTFDRVELKRSGGNTKNTKFW